MTLEEVEWVGLFIDGYTYKKFGAKSRYRRMRRVTPNVKLTGCRRQSVKRDRPLAGPQAVADHGPRQTGRTPLAATPQKANLAGWPKHLRYKTLWPRNLPESLGLEAGCEAA